MPLRLAEPPEAVREAVQKTLAARVERSDLATPRMRSARVGQLFLAAPHPVYTLPLRALVEGKGIEAAEPTGWRYLVQQGEETIASVELHGSDARALEVNEGPFVRATEEGIARAAEWKEVADGSFELRVLRVPAVYLVALWLKADSDGDLLLPIGQVPPEVEGDRLYRPEELLAALAEPARRHHELDSSSGQAR